MELSFDTTFDISKYGGKLFEAKPLAIGTEWKIPGVEAATSEGQEVRKLVAAVWAKEMEAFKKAREKECKDILALTERAIYTSARRQGAELMGADPKAAQSKLMKWLDSEAQTANALIRNALATFKNGNADHGGQGVGRIHQDAGQVPGQVNRSG